MSRTPRRRRGEEETDREPQEEATRRLTASQRQMEDKTMFEIMRNAFQNLRRDEPTTVAPPVVREEPTMDSKPISAEDRKTVYRFGCGDSGASGRTQGK